MMRDHIAEERTPEWEAGSDLGLQHLMFGPKRYILTVVALEMNKCSHVTG
jgi:hypothetical protein